MQCRLPRRIPERSLADQISAGGGIRVHAGFRLAFRMKPVKWHFIPPSAPHFGGFWEAGLKAMKYHLKRVLGSRTLSQIEFTALLCQIETCLNSRPISALQDDPNDLTVLTPGHFLIGHPLVSPPEESTLDIDTNRLSRWQQVRAMLEQFLVFLVV